MLAAHRNGLSIRHGVAKKLSFSWCESWRE
jgi:hypothetical protein